MDAVKSIEAPGPAGCPFLARVTVVFATCSRLVPVCFGRVRFVC